MRGEQDGRRRTRWGENKMGGEQDGRRTRWEENKMGGEQDGRRTRWEENKMAVPTQSDEMHNYFHTKLFKHSNSWK